jgi:hypothetical protein
MSGAGVGVGDARLLRRRGRYEKPRRMGGVVCDSFRASLAFALSGPARGARG